MEHPTEPGLPPDIAAAIPRAAGGAPGARHYEFDESQNTLFGDLARAMSFVGTFYVILGGISGLGMLVTVARGSGAQVLNGLLQTMLLLPIGIWTRRAARAASAITTSRGNDIEHLMSAMEELRRVYELQRTLLLVVLGLAAIASVIGLVAMTARGA